MCRCRRRGCVLFVRLLLVLMSLSCRSGVVGRVESKALKVLSKVNFHGVTLFEIVVVSVDPGWL